MRWSEDGYLSRIVLAHTPRQASVSLILVVGQNKMSYYLMVFDPEKAPRGREDFLAWFHEQTEWRESHDYNEPVALAPILRPYFDELIREFPPMNGSYRSEDFDDPKVTDYSIGSSIIYGAFAWSVADEARTHIKNLAVKHRVGFFEAGIDDGEIWTPEM